MRKPVLFLAVLIFASPLVFGQLQYGGIFHIWGNAARDYISDNKPDEDEANANADWLFNLWAGAVNSEKTIGGKGALQTDIRNGWAYIWWKPIEQIYIRLGNLDEDCVWAGADIAGWGLHANGLRIRDTSPVGTGAGSVAYKADAYAGNFLADGTGFFSGSWGNTAGQLSVIPLENLTLNIGFGFLQGRTAKETYLDGMNLQLVYNIPYTGEASLGFTNARDGGTRNIYAQWTMPLAYNVTKYMAKLEIGVNYGINADYNVPIKAGLGFGWGDFLDDPLVINARAAASIPLEDTDDPIIGFDLVFSYGFQRIRIYVPAGFAVSLGDDTLLAWNFGPYLARKIMFNLKDGPVAYFGFTLYNGANALTSLRNTSPLALFAEANDSNQINWAIPIGIRWAF